MFHLGDHGLSDFTVTQCLGSFNEEPAVDGECPIHVLLNAVRDHVLYHAGGSYNQN